MFLIFNDLMVFNATFNNISVTSISWVSVWLTGQWFSPGTPVSSTNKTDSHDISSCGLRRNSEHHHLYSSINPTYNQAGLMMTCSPESSSNNISPGIDQRGQGYQGSIDTDTEPNISSVNNDLENKTGMI